MKSLNTLVDSGAMGHFITKDYIKASRLTTQTLLHLIQVHNVDRTPNGETGYITEVVDLIL